MAHVNTRDMGPMPQNPVKLPGQANQFQKCLTFGIIDTLSTLGKAICIDLGSKHAPTTCALNIMTRKTGVYFRLVHL